MACLGSQSDWPIAWLGPNNRPFFTAVDVTEAPERAACPALRSTARHSVAVIHSAAYHSQCYCGKDSSDERKSQCDAWKAQARPQNCGNRKPQICGL